jgi:hypothetical protein
LADPSGYNVNFFDFTFDDTGRYYDFFIQITPDIPPGLGIELDLFLTFFSV